MFAEFAVLLPHVLHDGSTVDFQPIETQLLETFGGFTADAPCKGAWRDPKTGRVYFDVTTRYLIGTDNPSAVLDFAAEMAARLDQECIFVKHPDNSISFVERRAADVAANG